MTNFQADDGTLINYEVHGEAPGKESLLLLPGLLGSISKQWHDFLPHLTSYFRVILMDLRGHGHSENKASLLSPERMVLDIEELLAHLKITQVHVAGYSLGGYLGLMLHLKQPRLVSTLLMHATKFYWTEESVAQMHSQLDPDIIGEKVPKYANQLANEHGSRWRMLVRQAADLTTWTHKNGLTEGMVKRVQCPTLVSVGDRDELVLLREAQRLSRLMPNGELLVLPGVSHPFKSIHPVPLLPMMQVFHRHPDKR